MDLNVLAIFVERLDAGAFAEFQRWRNWFFFQDVRIEFLHGSS